MTVGFESRMIDVPAGSDAGTQIPVTTIRGAAPGPTLALIAGNHGYEYPPILALQKLRTLIDPAKLKGTIIMVHVANMPSFLGRTVYFSPVDGKNLNRVYPGRKDGTGSERIADAITTEVIEKADYVLDLHCGDGNESLRPYVYQTVTGNQKMDDAMARMALAFGIDHIVVDRNRPTDPARSLYCSTTAITRQTCYDGRERLSRHHRSGIDRADYSRRSGCAARIGDGRCGTGAAHQGRLSRSSGSDWESGNRHPV